MGGLFSQLYLVQPEGYSGRNANLPLGQCTDHYICCRVAWISHISCWAYLPHRDYHITVFTTCASFHARPICYWAEHNHYVKGRSLTLLYHELIAIWIVETLKYSEEVKNSQAAHNWCSAAFVHDWLSLHEHTHTHTHTAAIYVYRQSNTDASAW